MDGFMLFDTQWRYTYINAQASPFTGKPREELLGKNVWEEFPALVNSSFYQQYHEALLRQEPVAFEAYSALLQRWFDIRAYPVPDGLAVYFRDITGRNRQRTNAYACWKLRSSPAIRRKRPSRCAMSSSLACPMISRRRSRPSREWCRYGSGGLLMHKPLISCSCSKDWI